MNFLDANVVLRYVTGDDARKMQRCEALFLRVEQGRETLYTNVLVIAEVIWVLGAQYRHPRPKVIDGIRRLLNTRHILVEDRESLLLALQLFEQHPIDFIDAYNAALMQARGIETIYSYDQDFDRISGLQRLEP